ncbi:MAG TPA: FtsX-like permease family protein [Fibrobacteraceae bacterium]|nr:FtsX-like permease family protein [Fibrobacteraceae bacterium]
MISHLELQIAWRYTRAQRKSLFVSLISLFSGMGVAIGTFALIVALAATNGFEQEVTRQMIDKDSHFEVLAYRNTPIENYDSVDQAVRQIVPEVQASSPFILYKVGISSKKVNDGIVIYGIDGQRAAQVVNIKDKVKWGTYTTDSLLDSTGTRRPSIMLGSVLASRLKVILGDKVVLQTFQSPDDALGGKMMQFVVAGVFETGMYEYDANLGYIGIPEAQALLGIGDGVSGIQFRIDDPWKSEVAAQRVESKLGYPYYASDWKAKNTNLLKWMNYEKFIVAAIIMLIILVAAFNIISSLIMVVLQKTREIGILRSMGLSSQGIMRIFMAMGSFIGLAGTLLGGTAGVSLCLIQEKWRIIKLPADVYMIPYFPVQIQWSHVLVVFVIANALCILATLLPAWKASKLDPVGAIRHE